MNFRRLYFWSWDWHWPRFPVSRGCYRCNPCFSIAWRSSQSYKTIDSSEVDRRYFRPYFTHRRQPHRIPEFIPQSSQNVCVDWLDFDVPGRFGQTVVPEDLRIYISRKERRGYLHFCSQFGQLSIPDTVTPPPRKYTRFLVHWKTFCRNFPRFWLEWVSLAGFVRDDWEHRLGRCASRNRSERGSRSCGGWCRLFTGNFANHILQVTVAKRLSTRFRGEMCDVVAKQISLLHPRGRYRAFSLNWAKSFCIKVSILSFFLKCQIYNQT